MTEHPNVELAKKGYDAFAKGDIATLTAMFAEDVVWHSPGNNPLSGEHRGKGAVLAFLRRLGELSAGTLRFEVRDVLANDEHAVVMAQETAGRQGKQLNLLEIVLYRITDGKVMEAWSFPYDQRAADEFWSAARGDAGEAKGSCC